MEEGLLVPARAVQRARVKRTAPLLHFGGGGQRFHQALKKIDHPLMVALRQVQAQGLKGIAQLQEFPIPAVRLFLGRPGQPDIFSGVRRGIFPRILFAENPPRVSDQEQVVQQSAVSMPQNIFFHRAVGLAVVRLARLHLFPEPHDSLPAPLVDESRDILFPAAGQTAHPVADIPGLGIGLPVFPSLGVRKIVPPVHPILLAPLVLRVLQILRVRARTHPQKADDLQTGLSSTPSSVRRGKGLQKKSAERSGAVQHDATARTGKKRHHRILI